MDWSFQEKNAIAGVRGRGRAEWVKGVNYMVADRNSAFDGEYTVVYGEVKI